MKNAGPRASGMELIPISTQGVKRKRATKSSVQKGESASQAEGHRGEHPGCITGFICSEQKVGGGHLKRQFARD